MLGSGTGLLMDAELRENKSSEELKQEFKVFLKNKKMTESASKDLNLNHLSCFVKGDEEKNSHRWDEMALKQTFLDPLFHECSTMKHKTN